jgi:hypothetical protein
VKQDEQINSSSVGQIVEQKEINQNPISGEAPEELENLTEDIFENFGLSLQIIEDFIKGKLLSEDTSLTDE